MSGTKIQSVGRALSILDHLVQGPKNLSELSALIGIGAAGTLKLLRTLMEHELVEKHDNGTYWPGVGCCAPARSYLQKHDICSVAREEMYRLSNRTGSRTVLATLDGLDQVNLLCVDLHMSIPADEIPLKVGPAWPQATGRVLLAFAPAEVLQGHLDKYPLRPGVRGVKSPDQFSELLAEIRASGRAVVKLEEDGLHHFVAAAIRNYMGSVTAALGAHVTAEHPLETQIELISRTAERISQRLGHSESESGDKNDNGQ
ncbi:MAG: helix-turn-helix domain-containing protein [Phycisphaerae bacterium]|nr:helix-turn-helix domain-containing protein [Phycisphaerae bacterium]